MSLEAPNLTLPPALPVEADQDVFSAHRELLMRELLGVDYDYAVDSGLLNQFQVDPSRNVDGVQHILTGQVTRQNGTTIAEGFHHEPSARDPRTYVERSHLDKMRPGQALDYAEYPYEPYMTKTIIEGSPKGVAKEQPDGTIEITYSKSAMFPRQYDPLTVLRTVVQARDKRTVDADKLVMRDDKQVLVNDTEVALLDGQTMMPLRLLMDPETKQIITAFPRKTNRRAQLDLSGDKLQQHLGLA